jgi:hypothetical protein
MMTETEWLGCTDPERMLEFLRHGIHVLVDEQLLPAQRETMRRFLLRRVTDWKLHLFACACCRQIWNALKDERSRTALEIAERFADGVTDSQQLGEAASLALTARDAITSDPSNRDPIARHIARVAAQAAWQAVSAYVNIASYESADVAAWTGVASSLDAARAGHAEILRDLFGNPFHPWSLNPAWRTPAVLAVAEAAYQERCLPSGTLDNARLAVLADALEEAGADEAPLAHLRSGRDHWRGCHLLDALLGREQDADSGVRL